MNKTILFATVSTVWVAVLAIAYMAASLLGVAVDSEGRNIGYLHYALAAGLPVIAFGIGFATRNTFN